MDMDESFAPFPGAARDASAQLGAIDGKVFLRPQYPASVEQPQPNNGLDALHAANRPSRPQMGRSPPPSTSTQISVVLMSSPIKADEYAEHEVKDTDADEAPVKKRRGRPKGTRLGTSHAEVQARGPPVRTGRLGRLKQIPNYSLKRRRQTVARAESPPPRQVYLALQPTFTRFLCEWSNCKADLHNLETLRRHVAAVHVKSEQGHGCRWGKCAVKPVKEPPADSAALIKHLERAHLVPMSWHVGDGPRNSWNWSANNDAGADEIPEFLKDRDGNQVTPSTRDQEIEDRVTYRNNRRRLRELIMRRDENLESQSSDASEDEDMLPSQ